MFRHDPDATQNGGAAGGAEPVNDRGGWVLFHRSLAEHQLWLVERFTKGQAWADLILLASHKDHICTTGNVATPVKRGQVLTSQVKLAKRWRWDRETVARFLKLLETLKMCHIETSKRTDTGYTLLTLLNYERLQRTSVTDPASDPASGQHRASTHASLSIRDKKGKKESTTSSAPGAPEAAEVSTTPEQHAKEELRWSTPEALVALYHELTKLPRVTLPLSPARTTKAKDYLKKFPDREFWVRAFTEISRSTFLSGRRRDPGHEHFKVDFDWLLTKGKADQVENIMKVYEGKYRDAAATGVEMRHIWSCTACGITHRGTEAQYQAKACLKGVA